jgi:hypothetical protein
MTALQKTGRVSPFFLWVLAEIPKKQGKTTAEHSQRIAEARQVCRSMP